MSHPILPGSTIGMVGGGQLGRMFSIAAAQMGYRVCVFCEREDEPAAQVAQETVLGRLDDPEQAGKFAAKCDVITLEFENIPTETIATCERFAPTYPSASVLETAQDRLREKSTLRNHGLPVTPFTKVNDSDSLRAFARQVDYPVIVKTNRSGYDGKGQYRLNSDADADLVPWSSVDGWIAEQCIAFDKEISVVVARTRSGEQSAFPVFENDHANHILDLSRCPADVSPDVQREACRIGLAVARAIDLVGLVCVEFFLQQERLMINEIAPRPHNSGHLTIEACATSQFQQHVRAICGLPLGDTSLVVGGAAMVNLLGDLWQPATPAWPLSLQIPAVNLHLYGKDRAKVGRKMGHLTAVAADVDLAVDHVLQARNTLATVAESMETT